jgi:hypothetical protein
MERVTISSIVIAEHPSDYTNCATILAKAKSVCVAFLANDDRILFLRCSSVVHKGIILRQSWLSALINLGVKLHHRHTNRH